MTSWKEHLKTLQAIPRLSEDEEMQLSISARSGDSEAQNKLYRANLLLAAGLAYRLKTRLSYGNLLNVEDVYQEASFKLGQIIREKKYDPFNERGAKFSTYAARCMCVHLSSCISEKSFSIHIPKHVRAMLTAEDVKLALSGELTAAMLAERNGLDQDTAVSLLNVLQGVSSLNEPIDNNGAEKGDLIPDTNRVDDESINRTVLHEIVQLLLDKTFDSKSYGNTRPKIAYLITTCRDADKGCVEINIENTYLENIFLLKQTPIIELSSLDKHLDALISQVAQEGCCDKTLFKPEDKNEKTKSSKLRDYAKPATVFLYTKLKSYKF